MDARKIDAAPRYWEQPVECPECGKPYSENRLPWHRKTAHNIH